jgi:hypothetical protein
MEPILECPLSKPASRLALVLLLTGSSAAPVLAQDAVPSGLARVELERSRQCVEVLARVAALEVELEPLAERSQRLMEIANAIALEDRSGAEPFDASDPVESAVVEWFDRDQALALRYLEGEDETVAAERATGREGIKDTVSEALAAIQSEADGAIAAAGALTTTVGGCEGAILIRPAVLETCETTTSPVCDAATNAGQDTRYRFVDAPEDLWEVEEVRPWTAPSPLGVTPDGQVGGARTVGYARNGNLTLTVAFAPMFRNRSELTETELARYQSVLDSVGVTFDHPEVTFVPSLALRASAPEPLAGETLYVLHFDAPDAADVLWTGPSGTGRPAEATLPLTPFHLARLASGHPLSFTAVRETAGANGESAGDVVYTVEFTPLNQVPATTALMGYMASQLSQDLARIFPAGGR